MGSGTKRRNIASIESRKLGLTEGGGLELKCPPAGSVELEGVSGLTGLTGVLGVQDSKVVLLSEDGSHHVLSAPLGRILDCLEAGIRYEASIRESDDSIVLDFWQA